MKQKISIFLVLLMLISIFTFSACGKSDNSKGDITGYAKTASIIDREVPDFFINENGDFNILQITDTHLISGETKKDIKTLDTIEKQITELAPNLVVVSGDMIEGNNSKKSYNKKAALQAIGNMFERLNQYWAYVPGNNDGEYLGSLEDVAAFLSQYSHCIVSDEENLTGATQYTVDLKNSDGTVVHSLVFMDSLARDANNEYDYMKADQVEWLKTTLEAKKMLNSAIKVSVFFHMNTPDFAVSGKNGVEYKEGYNTIPTDFYDGIKGNAAIDDVMKNSGIVGLVSIGHIHPKTNYCSFYNGIYYHITRATGYSAAKNPGCTAVTIHTGVSDAKIMYDFTEIVF